MPVGFQARITVAFLAHVYRGRWTAVEYAKQFIKDHGMQNCVYGRELLRMAEQLDTCLLVDRVEGVVNYVEAGPVLVWVGEVVGGLRQQHMERRPD